MATMRLRVPEHPLVGVREQRVANQPVTIECEGQFVILRERDTGLLLNVAEARALQSELAAWLAD